MVTLLPRNTMNYEFSLLIAKNEGKKLFLYGELTTA
jgi:hypothetical protein